MQRSRRSVVAALAAASLAIGSAAADGEIIRLGDLEMRVDGFVKPRKLPKKKRAPVKLTIETDVESHDSSRPRPPVLEQIVLDFDRDGAIHTKGLPTCTKQELENTLTNQALSKCRKALVGKGETNAIIDFPDQAPFGAAGPLLAFNGKPRGRKPVIIFHVYACVPAPTTFVIPAVISRAPGKSFGERVTVDVPEISGGHGSLTHFDVTIGGKGTIVPRCPTPGDPIKVKSQTKWRHKGRKRSYLAARCRTGHFIATGEYRFRDGSLVNGSVVRECGTRRG